MGVELCFLGNRVMKLPWVETMIGCDEKLIMVH
jgi:hypothetical protein